MSAKKRLSRRAFLKQAGLATAAGLLAACSQATTPEVVEDAPAQGEEPEEVVEATPEPSEPVTLTYWLPPTTEQVYREEKINEFMEMNSNITVEMDGADPANYNEATQLLFKGGDQPDVFWKYNLSLPEMIDQDQVQPFPQEAQDYLRSAYPQHMFLEGINVWDGEIYGFWPVGSKSATRVLYCNNQLFDQAGVEPPTTWSEFSEAAKALAEAGAGQSYGLILGGKSPWDYTALIGGLAMSAGEMASANGQDACVDWTRGELTIAEDYFVDALDLVYGMLEDGSLFPGFTTISHTEARAGLANGWAGMFLGGWWDAGAYNTQFPEFEYTVVAPPVFDDGKMGFNHGAPFVDRVYVSKNATNLDAIAKFLIYKFGPEYQMGWARNGWFTALPEANEPDNISDPIVQSIFEISNDVLSIPIPISRNVEQAQVNAERNDITPDWGGILEGVFSDQIAPEDYKAEAQAFADAWREELERAITEVAGRGANVSIDDWVFDNWDPNSNYTAEMYEEL